jgi:hypothetical protein
MPTRQEIAASATEASARAARRRRFNGTVVDMCEHPEDIGSVAEMAMVNILQQRGWTVGRAPSAKA